MHVEIPGFEARGVWEITEKVGNLSGAVNLHSTAYDSATGKELWVDQEIIGEKRMRHSLGFGFSQRGSHDDVNLRIEYTNLEDIFAIEAVFAEMTRLIPLIESGEVAPESGYLKIHATGTLFAFSMLLSTQKVTAYTRDGDSFKPVGVEPNKAFANYLSVYVITPGGEVKIGGYDLYCGMSSALRVAHDFEVMRALIDGKPESEILAMKPIREPEPRLNPDIRSVIKELRDLVESKDKDPSREEPDPESPPLVQPET